MIVSTSITEPVDAAYVKSYLHWDDFSDETILNDYITAARELLEEQLNLSLAEKQYRQWVTRSGSNKITLLYPPHYDTSSLVVKKIDQDGSETTLTKDTDFYVYEKFAWEIYLMSTGEKFKIDFMAGYGTSTESLPITLKMAIVELVGNWYEGEVELGELSKGVEQKVNSFSKNTII